MYDQFADQNLCGVDSHKTMSFEEFMRAADEPTRCYDMSACCDVRAKSPDFIASARNSIIANSTLTFDRRLCAEARAYKLTNILNYVNSSRTAIQWHNGGQEERVRKTLGRAPVRRFFVPRATS